MRLHHNGSDAYIDWETGVLNFRNDTTTRFTIAANGNVGINDSTPSYKLDVDGDINFTGTLRKNGTEYGVGGGGSSNWTLSSGSVSRTSGNVGIGTNVMLAALHIQGDPLNTNQPTGIMDTDTSDSHTGLFLCGSGNVNGEKYGMQFGNYVGWAHSGIFGVMDDTTVESTGDITFDFRATNSDVLLTERIRFTHEGQIGIGTNAPSYKFHVHGTTSNIPNGPHFCATTNEDSHPLFQQLNWTHNNISQGFDVHYTSGGWKMCDSGSDGTCAQFYKYSDRMYLRYDFNVAQGSVVSLKNAWVVDLKTGNMGIKNDSPTVPLDVTGAGRFTGNLTVGCLLYTSPSPRDRSVSRMPSSA